MERTDTSSPIYLASSADSSDQSSFTYSIKINLFVMTCSWHLRPRERRLHPLGSELSRLSIPALPVKMARQQTRSCFSEVRKAQHTTHSAPINTPTILPFPEGLRKGKRSDWTKKKKKGNTLFPSSMGIKTFVIQICCFHP